MPIDIDRIRPEKGGNPEEVALSEERRFRGRNSLDKTISLDKEWRSTLYQLEMARKLTHSYQKSLSTYYKSKAKQPPILQTANEITEASTSVPTSETNAADSTTLNTSSAGSNEDMGSWAKKLIATGLSTLPQAESLLPSQLTAMLSALKAHIFSLEDSVSSLAANRKQVLHNIGNIVHDSVRVSNNEEDNEVVRTWGFDPTLVPTLPPVGSSTLHHHEILGKLGGIEMKKGVEVAGHRGYYLKGCGVMLSMALVNYGLNFLLKKGYMPVQPPVMMRKDVMKECAELQDFEETLYRISNSEASSNNQASVKNSQGKKDISKNKATSENSSDSTDLFLIATSEQPLCALHRGETFEPKDLPLKYAGISNCFRREAGSHGKDTWGIFRVHQFDKVEQFCITTPEESWKTHEEMIRIAEEFYQSLRLPYRVVSIVSGALNDAAAKKYDLEAWFPGYSEFKELVSCSNCTDYQSRSLEIHLGYKTGVLQQRRAFVHLLNGTLVASQRCLCCILENYQVKDGVKVPDVLVPYVGCDFFKYLD